MKVKFLDTKDVKAMEVPQVFAKESVEYHSIDHVNWPGEFPYKPETVVAIAYTEDSILLHFKAKECGLRAYVTDDMGDVWTDACVEFFIAVGEDEKYYNIECNCLGCILLALGKDRYERQRATFDTVGKIDRWASYSKAQEAGSKDLGDEETMWEIAMRVPFEVFFGHNVTTLREKTLRGNIYKCGGTGKYEHYVSFFPIATTQPDFHRSEYFGTLEFKA